jgi:periplasmic protein TonB
MALMRSPKVVAFRRRAKHTRHSRWHAAVARLDARMDALERRLAGSQHASLGTRMRTAIIVSLLAHVLLIAGIGVKLPDLAKRDDLTPRLEIVLVNAQSKAAPRKADVLAQHNLDGGGNTDEKQRAKSPLPVVADQKLESDVQVALRRVERLEREAKELMVQKQAKATVDAAPPAPKTPEAQAEPAPTPPGSDLLQRSLEIARLEAQITRDMNAYQERPRKRFIGARAQEVRFARYVEDWRQKVERVGDLNYPQAARDLKLQGRLMVTVGIKADGSLDSIDINRPSGFRALDEGARRIVQLAAPFGAFPAEIAKDTDILYITRWWTFTSSDRFQSD